MIAQYGYKDGSGEYFININTDKCDGCEKCVEACPAGVLEVRENDFDPLEEDMMAAVTEVHRKKIKYSCAPCKPTGGYSTLPCTEACTPGAIQHSW